MKPSVVPPTAEAFLLARELETVAAGDLILAGDLNSDSAATVERRESP